MNKEVKMQEVTEFEKKILQKLLQITKLDGFYPEFDDKNPEISAACNGKKLLYGEKFMEFSEDEQIAVMLHEVGHSLFEESTWKETEFRCDKYVKDMGYGEALIRNYKREEEFEDYFDHPTWLERIERLQK